MFNLAAYTYPGMMCPCALIDGELLWRYGISLVLLGRGLPLSRILSPMRIDLFTRIARDKGGSYCCSFCTLYSNCGLLCIHCYCDDRVLVVLHFLLITLLGIDFEFWIQFEYRSVHVSFRTWAFLPQFSPFSQHIAFYYICSLEFY